MIFILVVAAIQSECPPIVPFATTIKAVLGNLTFESDGSNVCFLQAVISVSTN